MKYGAVSENTVFLMSCVFTMSEYSKVRDDTVALPLGNIRHRSS